MAYIPYRSDAPPPQPSEWEIPQAKRWPWITAIVAIVGGLAFAVYWVTRDVPPEPPNPPIALIPLPDGTELRLVETLKGSSFNVTSNTDYNGRIRWDNGMRRGAFSGGGYSSSGIGAGSRSAVWLVFSRFDPATQTFSRPALDHFIVKDTDERVQHHGNVHKIGNGTSLPPVVGVVLNVIPRREAMLTLSFEIDGQTIDSEIPNPFLDTASPPFTAKPLPQTIEVDGVVLELTSAGVQSGKSVENGRPRENWQVTTQASAKEPSVPGARFEISREFFDPTGNRNYSFLPLGDKVWGAEFSISESADYPFPPDRVVSLGKVKVPAAGSIEVLSLPPALSQMGIREAFLFGPGQFQFGNRQIKANGKVLGSISHSHSTMQNFTNWGLGFFSTSGNGIQVTRNIVRIRSGSDIVKASSSGSSMSNSERFEELSSFRSSKPGKSQDLKAGDEIEVEFIIRKTRNATVYFERPQIPKSPSK